MTEEEAIQLYLMQSDPMARATNDYGQGAGFLGLDSQPESWDRVGEKNDLYSDLFRMTRTYLPDFVDGLNPTVEDPGMYQGYRSDKADLYRNNPAYAQLEAAMAEGASFDEAVRLIAGNEEFAQYLPQDDKGRPDAQSFRQSAEGYVSERSREGREFDAFDAEKQAYDDFVRPRTGWDMDPGADSVAGLLRQVAPALPQRPAMASLPMGTKTGAGPKAPAPEPAGQYPGEYLTQYAQTAIGNDSNGKKPGGLKLMQEVNKKQSKGFRVDNSKREVGRREDLAYNKGVQAAYEEAKKRKEGLSFQSKKQENQAKLVRAYNMLMYGE